MSTRKYVYFGLLGAAALALVTAVPAAAHVTVQPGEAPKGGYAKLAFRVPNESDTAGTIKIEVSFPQDTPLSSVRTRPTPGWTAQVVKAPLATPVQQGERTISEAVTTVTWTAQPGVRIGPDEFTEFEVTTGPLPDAERLVLPTVQTYDDGKVVAWDAPPVDGGEEPERPAPVLTLVAAEDGHGHGTDDATGHDDGAAAEGAAAGADGGSADGTQAAADSRDDTARWLAGAGLAVGALGVGLAGGAVLAARRRGTGSP